MSAGSPSHQWPIMLGIAALLLGVAGWQYQRLGEICGVLAPQAQANTATAARPPAIADDQVIRVEAWCYDEGRRRICYAQ